MADESPHLIPETSLHSTPHADHDYSPRCPFCVIAHTYKAIPPTSAERNPALEPEQLDPPSYVLYSSEHVIAFLDIMPLTRGHVLVAPRKHRVKVGDLSPDEGAEIGRVLPLLSRSVMKAVMPDIPHQKVDYNVVQNNGPGAAQVVPHVHFHIVPRPPLNYVTPKESKSKSETQYPPNAQPTGFNRTRILFGRGMRDDLDYDDAAVLVEDMRRCIREEWEASSAGKREAKVEQDKSSVGNPEQRKGAWKV
ncbi:hypothetical protein PV08_08151 [Exophiala spinifera]|uniref:HIT domain-containing protein n=1 Tax=Exophiala spinifera TaxID=91928 RepID=A0A0D2BPF7_9EURO|nr:uncharacterized protein PV08_08151 [Exophiala spinifera]KIW12964.1 hypothetical protein PV08_08151 [Exophiala spinifera]